MEKTFEDAVLELEKVVETLEDGESSLEESRRRVSQEKLKGSKKTS